MSNGAGDEGLPAPRRSVEQNPFGGINPQAFKNLGIAQRELDHLPYVLKLGFQTADVFIGEGPAAPFFSLRLADDQDCGRVDDNRTLGRHGLDLEEGGTAAEQDRLDLCPLHDRQTVQEAPDVLQVPLRRGDIGRSQDNPFRRTALHFADFHRFIEPDAGVLPSQSVQLDPGLAANFFIGGHDLAEGLALSIDFHRVADIGVEDEAAAVGDGVLLAAAAGAGVDGRHAHREGVDARDGARVRGQELLAGAAGREK